MKGRYPLKAFFSNLKFKSKIVLSTSMILYLFVMCLGLLLFFRAVSIFNELSRDQIRQRMDSLHVNMTDVIGGYEKVITTMLIDGEFQKLLEKSNASLTEGVESSESIEAYIATLASGYIVNPEVRLYVKNTTLFSRETILYETMTDDAIWYQQLLRDTKNTIHWKFEKDALNPNGVFVCTSGVMNKATGYVSAYFWMSVNMSSILNLMKTSSAETSSLIILRDGSGDVMWASVGGILSDSYSKAIVQIPMEGSGSVQTTIDGRSYDLNYFSSSKYDYSIISIKMRNSTTTASLNFLLYFVFVLAAIITLSVITLLLSVNAISKRLSKLTSKVHAIDALNPVFINDITGTDELGELGHAFEDMLDRMKRLMDRNRQMERERFDLEFKMLQSQINPHFLFNTLSTINIQAREIQADNIIESINALAEFYRLSLSNGRTTITVRDEMKMLAFYLQICRIRYRNKLNVITEIDEQVLDCYMPKLILQPFIENSVFHGFVPNAEREPTIVLRISRDNEVVLFSFSDNGQGMDSTTIDHVMSGKSFAISNINTRIKLLYGNEFGVTLTSTIGLGTMVRVTIPFRKDEASDSL